MLETSNPTLQARDISACIPKKSGFSDHGCAMAKFPFWNEQNVK